MTRVLRGTEGQARFVSQASVAALGAGGTFQAFRFYSESFQPGQGLVEDEELGGGRNNLYDPTQQAPDLANPSGGMSVALDLQEIGYWLTSMLGAPDTTGSDPYTHVWTSAVSAPQLFGLELPIAGEIFRIVDAMAVSGMSINLGDEAGYRRVQLDTIQRSVRNLGSALSASVTDVVAREKLTGTAGVLKVNGTNFGNVLGGQMSFGNGAYSERYMDNSEFISAIETGVPSFSLSPQIRVRSGALSMLNMFDGKTPFSAELVFAKGSHSLSFLAPNVIAPAVSPGVAGPGGLDVSPQFMASQTDSAPMVTVTLVNDVASY